MEKSIVATAAEIRAWWTPKRFRTAYNMAMKELKQQGIGDPAYRLSLAIGRSPQTINSWCVGNWRPDPLSCQHIDNVFRTLLGEDWMDQVLAYEKTQSKI